MGWPFVCFHFGNKFLFVSCGLFNSPLGHMNKGFFLSFFLSFFQFCDIKSLENFPQKIAKLVEFTLEKQIIMNYFVKNETKFVKRPYEQGVFSFFLSFFSIL
jgi:hypothetical protein